MRAQDKDFGAVLQMDLTRNFVLFAAQARKKIEVGLFCYQNKTCKSLFYLTWENASSSLRVIPVMLVLDHDQRQ